MKEEEDEVHEIRPDKHTLSTANSALIVRSPPVKVHFECVGQLHFVSATIVKFNMS